MRGASATAMSVRATCAPTAFLRQGGTGRHDDDLLTRVTKPVRDVVDSLGGSVSTGPSCGRP
ncbi:hypothetical protein [Pararhodobacter aggregans]|uniref:hypothetical protein n=1 Tax=Pararhodobacter aggregans TaxID=404875 RepID=UPI000D403B79|nr:hypothetical protein [Pararhodobacter aggregans]PTX01187.1 hypothetical protein C8N33_108146 [Pararhodobacter aggregans]